MIELTKWLLVIIFHIIKQFILLLCLKKKNVNVFLLQAAVLCSIILLLMWNNEMINRFDEWVAYDSFNAETVQSQQKQTN